MLSHSNEAIFGALNSLLGKSELVDLVLSFFANGAGIALAALLCAAVLVKEKNFRKAARALLLIFIPVTIALVYAEILKVLFALPRPWIESETARILFEHGSLDSFPSGHATVYGALATSVYFYSKRFGFFVAILAVCIALSRVIAGVHWPTDIFAGLFIGFLVSYSFRIIIRNKNRRKKEVFQKQE